MSVIRKLAEQAASLPSAVKLLSHVPFKWRKGREFGDYSKQVELFEAKNLLEKKSWIFERTRQLVIHAEKNVPFYKEFYGDAGFVSSQLKSYDDLVNIPIVTKADLKTFSIDDRCAAGIVASNSNTGGTTGQPLSFRVEPSLVDKEWAYIYHMWRRRGWKPGFVKLRFGGTNLGTKAFKYMPSEGEFLINTYLGQEEICDAIAGLLKKYPIHYLHGYPSALGAFARHAGEHYVKEIVNPIRKHLRGILLGSEFPAPCYRDIIEDTFGNKTLSWYGHSEKAVLAGEKDEPFLYYPFQGYGLTEAVHQSGASSFRLIGTNLHGFASPFIRYDTGDLIEPVEESGGLLTSFKVAEGRIGDMVSDMNGDEISLTALIFGRHHDVFSKVRHLQVAQHEPGKVLLITTGYPDTEDKKERFWKDFDITGVAIDFNVMFLDEPVRSPAGKVALKVPYPKSLLDDQKL